jgi:hypothetical protein
MVSVGSRRATRSVTHSSDPRGFVNGAVSGTNVAFNLNAEPAAFSGSAFTFNSAYSTGAWNDGLNIHVEGYLASTLVHSIDFTVDATGPTLEIFNWVVDDVHFSSWAATNFWSYVPGSGTSNLTPYLYYYVDTNKNGLQDPVGAGGDSYVIEFANGSFDKGQWNQTLFDSSVNVHVVGNRDGLGACDFSSSCGGGC